MSCPSACFQEKGERPAPQDTACLTPPYPPQPGSKSTFSMRSSLATLALRILFPQKTPHSQSQTDFWHASVCFNPLWPGLWFCNTQSFSTALAPVSLWCSHEMSQGTLAKRVHGGWPSGVGTLSSHPRSLASLPVGTLCVRDLKIFTSHVELK